MAKTKRNKKKQRDWAKIGRWSLRTVSVLFLLALAIGMTFGVDRLRTHADSQLRLVSESPTGVEITFVWPTLESRPGETWLPAADQPGPAINRPLDRPKL